MKLQFVSRWMVALVLVQGFAAAAFGEDVYYRVRVDALKLTDGEIPAHEGYNYANWRIAEAIQPYVRLDNGGEAYCVIPDVPNPNGWETSDRRELFVRAPGGAEVTGKLYLHNTKRSGLTPVSFVIPAKGAGGKERESFLRAKMTYYDGLVAWQIPGGAWFRHQSTETRAALGKVAGAQAAANNNRQINQGMDDTFGLFTGGKALSENLQLDRTMLTMPETGARPVKLKDIRGITVREIDWKPLVKGKDPELDPLAAFIPADQHAIFFPTFDAFTALADEADRAGTPIVQLLEPRSEDAGTKAFYQRQMCLSLTGLGRILGPKMVNSVAVTGSDPYLRVGSDLAIVFQAKDVNGFENMLKMHITMASQLNPAAKTVTGRVMGVEYSGAVSPDRTISAYLMKMGDAIAVSNSLAQLERLAAVHQKREASLGSLPEYVFFRDRYKRGEGGETALLMLSDATIRRWCGPRWRIADSRRTRAGAVMASFQAQNMDGLAKNSVEAGAIPTWRTDAGELSISGAGVASSVYGGMDFMTPIIELEIDSVTAAEAQSYERWRDTYQQNWSQFFDPIAIRLVVNDKKLAADMTVMPLIARTDYREWIDISRGVKLSEAFTDPHDSLLHFALAINKDSQRMKWVNEIGRSAGPAGAKLELLSWLGKSFSIYVDDDPFWKEMAKAEDPEKFLQDKVGDLPVAVSIDVADPLKMALFMVSLRMYVEGAVPGLTSWTAVKYKKTAYTKIELTENGRNIVGKREPLAIYYAPLPDQLVFSFNESVIQRAVDRHLERVAAKAAGKKLPAPARPVLGESAALQIDKDFAKTAGAMLGMQLRPQLQLRAWGNIPILNEWKRLYPEHDPVQLHEKLWQSKLLCPGGGQYVWNEKWQTMESTVYGHPGEPKPGPALPAVVEGYTFGSFGVTFEENGLRARAELEKK